MQREVQHHVKVIAVRGLGTVRSSRQFTFRNFEAIYSLISRLFAMIVEKGKLSTKGKPGKKYRKHAKDKINRTANGTWESDKGTQRGSRYNRITRKMLRWCWFQQRTALGASGVGEGQCSGLGGCT